MRPDGTVDESCLQSMEVWTGVTYAVASAMLLHVADEIPIKSSNCFISHLHFLLAIFILCLLLFIPPPLF